MDVTMAVRASAAAVTGLFCALHTASAQDTDELTIEIGECIAIEAPVERLACFASQVEQALTESEATQSEDGSEQVDAAADERTVEVSPPQRAAAEPSSPAQQPREEPVSAAQQTDAEPASPAAETAQASESDGQDPEPEAIAAADTAADADMDDLNWWQRRQARRAARAAARAAEREAAERAEAAEAAENEILATVTDLRERQPNAWLVTLDNGQVWEQVRPEWYPLRPGQEVRLYPTRWGDSYRLSSIVRGGYIQVQRVR